MFCGRQISFRRFQRNFRNQGLGELRRFEFYNREMNASAALEQEEGEATSGKNLAAVLET
jgi:hypothetical protein